MSDGHPLQSATVLRQDEFSDYMNEAKKSSSLKEVFGAISGMVSHQRFGCLYLSLLFDEAVPRHQALSTPYKQIVKHRPVPGNAHNTHAANNTGTVFPVVCELTTAMERAQLTRAQRRHTKEVMQARVFRRSAPRLCGPCRDYMRGTVWRNWLLLWLWQRTDPSSRQRQRSTSTNLQLSDSNKDLVLSP
jgi:hypothetical protein